MLTLKSVGNHFESTTIKRAPRLFAVDPKTEREKEDRMAKTIEDRKNEGPILPAWMSTVGSYKQLSGGQFKPEITPLLKRYDQCIPEYDKLMDQKKALLKTLKSNTATANNTDDSTRDKLAEERDKIGEQTKTDVERFADEFSKYDEEADLADVDRTLGRWVTTADEHYTVVSTLTQRIATLNSQSVAKVKKVRSDFKSKADAITAGLTKVTADAEKTAGAIRQVIQTYQKIAAGMKDDGDGAKIASAIRGFADLV
jgi:chaperonin cofactor prefoldin